MTKDQLLENKVRARMCLGTLRNLLLKAPLPQILLVRVLDYHVVPGVAAKADDLSDGQKARLG